MDVEKPLSGNRSGQSWGIVSCLCWDPSPDTMEITKETGLPGLAVGRGGGWLQEVPGPIRQSRMAGTLRSHSPPPLPLGPCPAHPCGTLLRPGGKARLEQKLGQVGQVAQVGRSTVSFPFRREAPVCGRWRVKEQPSRQASGNRYVRVRRETRSPPGNTFSTGHCN